jgi:Flp pilus assembly pilin Flp
MLSTLRNCFLEFLHSEKGATSVEYAINLALIGTVIVSSVASVGNKAKQSFTKVSNSIANTTGS